MVRNYLATSDTIWNCQKLSGIARKKICIASLRAFNVFHININFYIKVMTIYDKIIVSRMASITAFTTQETFVWNLPGIFKRKFGRKRGKKLVYTL